MDGPPRLSFRRLKVSPLGDPMEGVCPTFICASTHEVTYDEDKALHEKMKAAGEVVEGETRERSEDLRK